MPGTPVGGTTRRGCREWRLATSTLHRRKRHGRPNDRLGGPGVRVTDSGPPLSPMTRGGTRTGTGSDRGIMLQGLLPHRIFVTIVGPAALAGPRQPRASRARHMALMQAPGKPPASTPVVEAAPLLGLSPSLPWRGKKGKGGEGEEGVCHSLTPPQTWATCRRWAPSFPTPPSRRSAPHPAPRPRLGPPAALALGSAVGLGSCSRSSPGPSPARLHALTDRPPRRSCRVAAFCHLVPTCGINERLVINRQAPTSVPS